MKYLYNGKIVCVDKVLDGYAIYIFDNKIHSIIPECDMDSSIEKIDCGGAYILPGLVDIHCDYLERVIVPRKGIIFDTEFALRHFDKELLAHGITTIFHSISIANSTITNKKRTLSVEQMLHIGEIITKSASDLCINHKYHARLELNTTEAVDRIMLMIEDGDIDLFSIMNHTPGQGQYHDLEQFKHEIFKQYGAISSQKQFEVIEQCTSKTILSNEKLLDVINRCHAFNIPIAYHDVDCEEVLSFMDRNDINISEFPLNDKSSISSYKHGFFNVVGSPNVLLGGSHNNNLSATETIKKGHANVLCSDYFPCTLLDAIFYLKNIGVNICHAVNLATYYPAKATGMSNYGLIDIGAQADLIVVCDDKYPIVKKVFINGIQKYQLGE